MMSQDSCWHRAVLGLRWSDIDLDAATLSIRRSVSCTGYRVHTTPTKTRTSRRAIDLDQRTAAVLRDWKRHQLGELGTVPADGTVFTRADGQPVHPHKLSQTVARLQRLGGCTGDQIARSPSHARHADVEARGPVEGGQRTPRALDTGVHDGRLPARAARHATRRRQHLRPTHHTRRSRRNGRMMAVAGR